MTNQRVEMTFHCKKYFNDAFNVQNKVDLFVSEYFCTYIMKKPFKTKYFSVILWLKFNILSLTILNLEFVNNFETL